MHLLKQSTAASVLVGPVLDSTGAAYTGMAIADFNLTKNGTSAAMAAAATATHDHNGHYVIALTAGNTDTLGRATISCNKSTYAMSVARFSVLNGTTFDAVITNAAGANGGLPTTDASNGVKLSVGTGTGQVNAASGKVPVTLAAGDVATDAITAAAVKADAVTKIQAGLSTYAGADTSGITALLGRLTLARSGYLDNLNVGGPVASHADVTSLDTATPLARAVTVPAYVKPASGTIAYPVILETRALGGALTDVDTGIPGITAVVTNGAGTDRSANFAAWTHTGTGTYQSSYTVGTSSADEGLILRFTGAVGGTVFSATATPEVADYSAYGTADRAMLTALTNGVNLLTWLGVTPNALQSGRPDVSIGNVQAGLGVTPPIDANAVAVNGTTFSGPSVPAVLAATQPNYAPSRAGDAMALTSAYDAAKTAGTSNYAGGPVAAVTAPVTVAGTVNATLIATGLDAIPIEGLNARQVLDLIAAVLLGTVAGQDANAPVFKGAGVTTTRVSATTDANGNRSAVTLNPPA